MGRTLHRQVARRGNAARDDGRWVTGIEGIVAVNEDPNNQHRIKVIIPMLDENLIYDKWVRQVGVYMGGNGFGSFFIPPCGSEVILFGRLGQKHNLYYMCVYNEDFEVPMDFRNDDGGSGGGAVCGFRVPGEFKLISDYDMQLRMGRGRFESDASMEIIAPAGFFVNGKKIL